jgi:hypothetical protein
MEQIKEAFYKVKQDIEFLKKEVLALNKGLLDTRESLVEMCEILKTLSKKNEEKKKDLSREILSTKEPLTQNLTLNNSSSLSLPSLISNPAQNIQKQTTPADIPTDKILYNPQNPQKTSLSFPQEMRGFQQTDRQTNRQTST